MAKRLKRANEYFSISAETYRKTGAFNAIIGVDSLFFIDPLLLAETKTIELQGGLNKIRKYFSDVVTLIKTNNPNAWAKARSMLTLREVKGVGIGYGSASDDGSAIGKELANKLLYTASELIKMGITDPAIFEVMGLFEENFGPDRLSDSLIRILRSELYSYSERITKELKIKSTVTIKTYERNYIVAEHPFGGKPLVFIPNDILRNLPIASSFHEISEVAIFNEDLRRRFNSIIASCFADNKRPTKREIKQYLLADKSRIGTLVEAYEKCKPSPYDFENDPVGLNNWLEKAEELVKGNPISVPKTVDEKNLDEIVDKIIKAFKKFIEEKGGWRSLYSPQKKPLNESHARNFFYATALLYCDESNVDISPESNAGQGPVDFKLSRGRQKIVVEVKLSCGHVLQGYEKQTGIYQKSEEAETSYFIVIRVTENHKILDVITKQAEEQDKKNEAHPAIVIVDGRPKLSASKA